MRRCGPVVIAGPSIRVNSQVNRPLTLSRGIVHLRSCLYVVGRVEQSQILTPASDTKFYVSFAVNNP